MGVPKTIPPTEAEERFVECVPTALCVSELLRAVRRDELTVLDVRMPGGINALPQSRVLSWEALRQLTATLPPNTPNVATRRGRFAVLCTELRRQLHQLSPCPPASSTVPGAPQFPGLDS